METANKTHDVMLTSLAKDMSHVVEMLTELRNTMQAVEARQGSRIDKVESEQKNLEIVLRRELKAEVDRLRLEAKEAALEARAQVTAIVPRVAAAEEKATTAGEKAGRMLWAAVGALSVLATLVVGVAVHKFA